MSEDEDIKSKSSDEQAIDGDEWHMLKEIACESHEEAPRLLPEGSSFLHICEFT